GRGPMPCRFSHPPQGPGPMRSGADRRTSSASHGCTRM
ncbi:MAG: hypothetical protein AVDCRST_MAG89-3582, partial [uncultured Gemmatimonadetes bacterium]